MRSFLIACVLIVFSLVFEQTIGSTVFDASAPCARAMQEEQKVIDAQTYSTLPHIPAFAASTAHRDRVAKCHSSTGHLSLLAYRVDSFRSNASENSSSVGDTAIVSRSETRKPEALMASPVMEALRPPAAANKATTWTAVPINELMIMVLPLMMGLMVAILVGVSAMNAAPSKTDAACDETTENLPEMSSLAIMALTSYRFYTGFLNSTWMPFLLAMEGESLMGSRQSIFMGTAKLLFGLSIAFNPVFGLLGDKLQQHSVWGRKVFILFGVGTSGLGIYGCLLAAAEGSTKWYLLSCVLWMFGEALADVTTETIVPELLPRSQWSLSSSLRSLNSLLGGLAGYVILIFVRDQSHEWIYYAYFFLMFLCALVTLACMGLSSPPKKPESQQQSTEALFTSISKAYSAPIRMGGGFPWACLCQFIFSLGSAPMLFLLLIVRDIVGLEGDANVQLHFAVLSIVFFISAAVACLRAAVPSPDSDSGDGAPEVVVAEVSNDISDERWVSMAKAMCGFGCVEMLIPATGMFPGVSVRLPMIYVVVLLFGYAFGSVYSRFQECTWSLLPKDCDIANAMGFAAMSKMAGIGLGNFAAGAILDVWRQYHADADYQTGGYVLMCSFCCIVVVLSAMILNVKCRYAQTV